MVRFYSCLCMTVACAVPTCAKPIAFADGTTAMLEHGAGTMQEIQIFYAPRFNYSIGGGHLDLDSDIDTKTRHITYARLNWLAHRWNQASAQANLFVWGGLGSATGNTFDGNRAAINTGVQADYETRRIYTSLKFELDRSSVFSHRIDTLQLGVTNGGKLQAMAMFNF
jgi:hypothetical protein